MMFVASQFPTIMIVSLTLSPSPGGKGKTLAQKGGCADA